MTLLIFPYLSIWNYMYALPSAPFPRAGFRVNPTPRIVGGEVAKDVNFLAQIFVTVDGSEALCGGSIISRHVILTAAHCFDQIPQSVNDTKIYVGGKTLYKGHQLQVKMIFVHAKYVPQQYEYDIAIIIVDPPVKFDKKITKIHLANEVPLPGTAVWTAGFGEIDQHTLSKKIKAGVLNKVKLKIITNQQCFNMVKDEIENLEDLDKSICTFENGRDACYGDSGGPLYTDDKKELIGIVSWGIGCADPDRPGVFTDVTQFKKWIKKALKASVDEPHGGIIQI